MRRFVARLRTFVWTAILALVAGGAAVVTALFSSGQEVALSLGIFGIILAILTPKGR